MDFRQLFSTTGRNILLLIGQSIALVICVLFIESVYYTNILPDKTVNDTYEVAQCTITDKKLHMHGTLVHTYRADFLVNYSVDTKAYNAWVSGNGLDFAYSSDRAGQEQSLTQFDVGQSYPCWYNPENPKMVVLVLRHNWSSTFPLFIPSVIFLIVLYYFVRTLFELLGVATTTAREKISERKSNKDKKQ